MQIDGICVKDIDGFETFAKIKPLTKGLSGRKKFKIETLDGQHMILHISEADEYERMKAEYEMAEHAAVLDIQMSRPVCFGKCNNGKHTYRLLTWVEGTDAEALLPTLAQADQYKLGVKSGELLRKIHSTPAPSSTRDWDVYHTQKLQKWLDVYSANTVIHCAKGELIIQYLKQNSGILDGREQTFIHGDFNTENIIAMPNGEVGAIDFNSYNTAYGDPWFDLCTAAWMPAMFPPFYTGQLAGYFCGAPSASFWNVYTYYLAYDALAALADSDGTFGIDDSKYVTDNILAWTDGFKRPVPVWFRATPKNRVSSVFGDL